PGTWGRFDDAVAAVRAGDGTGVGIALGGGLAGVDLDHVRDAHTGLVDDAVMNIVRAIDSYTEVSPSGTGLHELAGGSLPAGLRRRGFIEMYDGGRFFTVTGRHVPGTVDDRGTDRGAGGRPCALRGGARGTPPAAAVPGAWLGKRRRSARPGSWCRKRRQVGRAVAGRHVALRVALRGRPRLVCHAGLLDRRGRAPDRSTLSGQRAHAAEMGCPPRRRDLRHAHHRVGARGTAMRMPVACLRLAPRATHQARQGNWVR